MDQQGASEAGKPSQELVPVQLPTEVVADRTICSDFCKPSPHESAFGVIRCSASGCTLMRSQCGGIKAPMLSTRHATVLWNRQPKHIALIKKWRDGPVRKSACKIAVWLQRELSANVYMDAEDDEWVGMQSMLHHLGKAFDRRAQRRAATQPNSGANGGAGSLPTSPRVSAEGGDEPGVIRRFKFAGPLYDLVICMGGDGTILHASHLFQGPLPPVLSISHGSLGFMTLFDVRSSRRALRKVHAAAPSQSARPALRSLASATAGSAPALSVCDDGEEDASLVVARGGGAAAGGAIHIDCGQDNPEVPLSAIPVSLASLDMSRSVELSLRMRIQADVYKGGAKEPVQTVCVLNEVTLDRGPSAMMSVVDAYVDNVPLTRVHADGLIVATPTGSTAYSVSAGGSMVHPDVPCILLTPICPHSLSFRPLIFADSSVIKLVVPADARASVWAAFDGRKRVELARGDYVVLRTSPWPLPLVAKHGTQDDWVNAITTKLNFNVRERQLPQDDDEGPAAIGVDDLDEFFCELRVDDGEEEDEEAEEAEVAEVHATGEGGFSDAHAGCEGLPDAPTGLAAVAAEVAKQATAAAAAGSGTKRRARPGPSVRAGQPAVSRDASGTPRSSSPADSLSPASKRGRQSSEGLSRSGSQPHLSEEAKAVALNRPPPHHGPGDHPETHVTKPVGAQRASGRRR